MWAFFRFFHFSKSDWLWKGFLIKSFKKRHQIMFFLYFKQKTLAYFLLLANLFLFWFSSSRQNAFIMVGFWMIYINTTKLSHRFHTVKPIHFMFFSSKFTRLNQCVRWQFRNHEVFLIYTRFLRGKIVFSTNNIFLCVKAILLWKTFVFFRKNTKNPFFFKKVPGVCARLKQT